MNVFDNKNSPNSQSCSLRTYDEWFMNGIPCWAPPKGKILAAPFDVPPLFSYARENSTSRKRVNRTQEQVNFFSLPCFWKDFRVLCLRSKKKTTPLHDFVKSFQFPPLITRKASYTFKRIGLNGWRRTGHTRFIKQTKWLDWWYNNSWM